MKLSDTVDLLLKHKGREIWSVSPDQSVYESDREDGRQGSGGTAGDFRRRACGHNLRARLRPQSYSQGKILKGDPGEGDHDEPGVLRDSAANCGPVHG
jgi:hypothetical protein